MKKSTYSMFCCLKVKSNTTYCVFLSNSNTHLAISIQSTNQIRNRYSLQNHSKPSFFLLYIPFNQSIILTRNTQNPYPARFLALNLTMILSSPQPFNLDERLLTTTTQPPSLHLQTTLQKRNSIPIFFTSLLIRRMNTTLNMTIDIHHIPSNRTNLTKL